MPAVIAAVEPDVAAAVEPEDVTDAEVKAGAEEVIDEEEDAIAAGASAKAVEAGL